MLLKLLKLLKLLLLLLLHHLGDYGGGVVRSVVDGLLLQQLLQLLLLLLLVPTNVAHVVGEQPVPKSFIVRNRI